MNAQEWKMLISAYADGEVTPEEKAVAERLIAEHLACKEYYEQLRSISSAIGSMPDDALSPDAETKVLSYAHKERVMNKKFVIPTVAVLSTVVVALLVFQTVIKSGMQGRLKNASDDMGDQYSQGSTNVLISAKTGAMHVVTDAWDKGKQKANVGWNQLAVLASGKKVNAQKSETVICAPIMNMDKEFWAEGQGDSGERVSEHTRTGDASTTDSGPEQSQIANVDQEFWGFADGDKQRKVSGGRADARMRAGAASTTYMAGAPAGGVQYEPYYQSTNYEITRDSVENKRQAAGLVAYETNGAPSRVLGAVVSVYPESTMIWNGDYDASTRKSYALQAGNTEEYAKLNDNAFLAATENPLSTFSIDVDTASYSNVRRFLSQNQFPPADAVRIEEMVNYFGYAYPQPEGNDPFSVTTNIAACPWNKQHYLLQIGIKGRTPQAAQLPASNLVFLIDTSGSMADSDKLPLLVEGFKMMVNHLRKEDKVSIVTYAGSAGKVLDSTPGDQKSTIIAALDRLSAGGSTAGGEGMLLAYQIAKENLIPGANNRVILATDGDFNVGVSSTADMIRMVEERRKDGIFLTILGFGQENLKDHRMEQMADQGNGSYYYIDNNKEAKKVLADELGSTLFTIAKDVKIQIEFNPAAVKSYRLIGYENRMLAKEDFNNDQKDAGEIGAGHTVTALYELVPAGADEAGAASVDALKYQKAQAVASDDVMTIKLRYKDPNADKSQLISRVISKSQVTTEPSGDFAWAASVAEFGMLLRHSEHKGQSTYDDVLTRARANTGEDKYGLRAEFISLVETARNLAPTQQTGELQFK